MKKKEYNFLFVFDQTKEYIFSNDNKLYLEKSEDNIKIIYSSSVSEKNIRKEWWDIWTKLKTNPKTIDKNNQNFYFY